MTEALTPDQRAELMRKAGIPEDVIAGVEPATVMPIINEEDALPEAPEPEPTPEPEHFTTAPVALVMGTDNLDGIAEVILKRAKGDKDKALALCDDHAQTWFDERKLSTKQAAAQGIERGVHNKPLWSATQDMRSKLKARVRQHFAGEGGFVKRKVAAHVPKTAIEQFLGQQNVSDPAVAAFLTEFTQFINRNKEGK